MIRNALVKQNFDAERNRQNCIEDAIKRIEKICGEGAQVHGSYQKIKEQEFSQLNCRKKQ